MIISQLLRVEQRTTINKYNYDQLTGCCERQRALTFAAPETRQEQLTF